MEIIYRLILYILLTNVCYMMFSLARSGFRVYAGYIAQLGVLTSFMVFVIAHGLEGLWSITLSCGGIFILVGMPLLFQRRIDTLAAEQRFDEIESWARWKARLAWSDLNVHLYEIAKALKNAEQNPDSAITALRSLLGRGEPFDSVTRAFIGMTAFNFRRFDTLLDILISPERKFTDYPFEELVYIVRALLETGRHEEAVDSQMALEKLASSLNAEKRANVIISRLIFFAMMGWESDFETLLETEKEILETLSWPLLRYWRGIAAYYAGRFEEGRALLQTALREAQEQLPETWIPSMRQRMLELEKQESFFANVLIPRLKELRVKYRDAFLDVVASSKGSDEVFVGAEKATKFLMSLLFGIFLLYTIVADQSDLMDLIRFGANSGFLVRRGEWFRLVSYQFLHGGWLHLFMNLLALKYFGPPIETVVGQALFFGIYLFSGICGGFATIWTRDGLSVGASAAVLGLLGAAISFELFGGPKCKALSKQGQLSTLIFILIANLAVGFFEKGIDNHAHIGGFLGGAVAGVVVSGLMERAKALRIASVISIVFVSLTLVLSAAQHCFYFNENRYPLRFSPTSENLIASLSSKIELPMGWHIDFGSFSQNEHRNLTLMGPFHERAEIVFIDESGNPDYITDIYVEQRTKAFSAEPDVRFESRRGPIKRMLGRLNCRVVIWRFSVGDAMVSQVDWFVFYKNGFVLVQWLLPTAHEELYMPMMEYITASIKKFN